TGELEKHAALERMLQGTGLEAIFSGENTATIRLISTAEPSSGNKGAGNDRIGPIRSLANFTLPDRYSGYLRLAQAQGTEQPASGQASDESVQEVVVTGLRQSLVNSMTIQRDSLGVVDAIPPEDIGKLPDTNLAESLQRITGVSIDRS